MALSFPAIKYPDTGCDDMVKEFDAFKHNDLESTEVFTERAKISPAYYYATGFNMRRLLDKPGVDYKKRPFTRPDRSLFAILSGAYARAKHPRQR
jgi:hypothetical protein